MCKHCCEATRTPSKPKWIPHRRLLRPILGIYVLALVRILCAHIREDRHGNVVAGADRCKSCMYVTKAGERGDRTAVLSNTRVGMRGRRLRKRVAPTRSLMRRRIIAMRLRQTSFVKKQSGLGVQRRKSATWIWNDGAVCVKQHHRQDANANFDGAYMLSVGSARASTGKAAGVVDEAARYQTQFFWYVDIM